MRRLQFQYYRDQLLTFDSDVEFVSLGDVAEIRSGFGFPNIEQGKSSGDLPFYKVGDMNHPENARYMTVADNYISFDTAKKLKCIPAPKDTVIFPKIGAAIATNKKRMLTVDSCYDNNVMGLIAGDKILPSFLYHIFCNLDLMKFTNYNGLLPSIRKSAIEQIKIPVPPVEKQKKIVAILDRFDSLCNDLTSGIPAEINARKKQYAFYRDKLLTFTQK